MSKKVFVLKSVLKKSGNLTCNWHEKMSITPKKDKKSNDDKLTDTICNCTVHRVGTLKENSPTHV